MRGLSLGLGLGGRGGGKRSRQAVFTWAGADSGTKRINFNADVKIRVTGTITLTIVYYYPVGTLPSRNLVITAADGWVTVSPTASEYYTFTCSGNGDIVFSDARKVSYLYLNGTLISISGDIGKCTGLTYLILIGTLISISGDIGKLTQLTYLSLNGTLISISGDIGNCTGLTYLSLYGTLISISGDIGNCTGLTCLYLNGTLISISGDIGKCTGLTYLILIGTLISISGDIGKLTQLTYLYLNGALISISGDIGNPLTTYIHNSSVNSSISVDVTLMTELTRLLGYNSKNIFYGTVNSKKLVVFQINNSTPAPIDKRITIPDGFRLMSVNYAGSASWIYVGVHSPQRLPAIESERLMEAHAEVINRLGAWDSRLIFSVRGADSDDPPSNDPLDADENGKTPYQRCMEHIQTIVNADRDVIVPAAWDWTIPPKEEA